MKETNSRNTVRRDQLINEQRRRLEERTLSCDSSEAAVRVRKYKTAQNTAEGEGGRGRVSEQEEGYEGDY